ncbi:hypothetical protein [Bradyrhizobium guangxiense]|uniref:hypothetical protein n=1 Tax=Bradyrhizobium guangxiense TaxID=1325115 RepID=UPI0010088355|nr:hypothetical protein [Bradyrhizobium guangxiense]
MPAFTFEKISPPARRAPAATAVPKKPRSVISQMIERIAERRARRALLDERAVRRDDRPVE